MISMGSEQSTIPAAGDHALVDALRTGSPFAFAELMRLFQPKIYRVGHRFTGNHHDAEDIVQETFLRAYRAAPRFRSTVNLGAWLYTIAANFARNQYHHWRRRRRHVTISFEAKIGESNNRTICDTLIVEDDAALTRIDQEDFAIHLGCALDRLVERDRRILIRRIVGHASYAELAREHEIAVGTVKSRLSRARERLRKRLNLATDQALGGYLPHSSTRARMAKESKRTKRNQCPVKGNGQ